MKKVKLKKDISKDVFIIKINNNTLDVVKFNNKIKMNEMLQCKDGVFTFETEEEAHKFTVLIISKAVIYTLSEKIKKSDAYSKRFELIAEEAKKEKEKARKEFEEKTGITISQEKRKRVDGKYNHPIFLKSNKDIIEVKKEFKKDFKEINDLFLIEIYDKSKGSIINKLTKLRHRGILNFVNYGNLINIY